jgi:multidrug efflux pump subunit AcrB
VELAAVLAVLAALGLILVLIAALGAFVVQRQDRKLCEMRRELREDLSREKRDLERQVFNANGETRVMLSHAVSSATLAAQAAQRAEDASAKSFMSSELSAERAEDARCRAKEARMFARITGAVRSRPVELRDSKPPPSNGNGNDNERS